MMDTCTLAIDETAQRSCERWLYAGVLGGCALLPLAFGLAQTRAHLDDAYITYRYALNLVQGNGFVYNAGEAVLGTTAPLYGLLLALLRAVALDIPLASHLLGAAGWTAYALLMERIGRAAQGRAVGLAAAALVAVSPLFLQALGMETCLTIALALGLYSSETGERLAVSGSTGVVNNRAWQAARISIR